MATPERLQGFLSLSLSLSLDGCPRFLAAPSRDLSVADKPGCTPLPTWSVTPSLGSENKVRRCLVTVLLTHWHEVQLGRVMVCMWVSPQSLSHPRLDPSLININASTVLSRAHVWRRDQHVGVRRPADVVLCLGSHSWLLGVSPPYSVELPTSRTTQRRLSLLLAVIMFASCILLPRERGAFRRPGLSINLPHKRQACSHAYVEVDQTHSLCAGFQTERTYNERGWRLKGSGLVWSGTTTLFQWCDFCNYVLAGKLDTWRGSILGG